MIEVNRVLSAFSSRVLGAPAALFSRLLMILALIVLVLAIYSAITAKYLYFNTFEYFQISGSVTILRPVCTKGKYHTSIFIRLLGIYIFSLGIHQPGITVFGHQYYGLPKCCRRIGWVALGVGALFNRLSVQSLILVSLNVCYDGQSARTDF